MKDAAANATAASTPAKAGAAKASRWASAFRIVFEFALLFAIAVAAKQILAASAAGSYPNPLWLPVIVLSLQHGMGAGLTAAMIAAGLQLAEGLPPQLMAEDMYSYIGRVAAEPIGWTCVALLIGHVRSRQAAERAELEAELAERTRDASAVAALCIDLRSRLATLERHIAAESRASDIEVVDAAVTLVRSASSNSSSRVCVICRLRMEPISRATQVQPTGSAAIRPI